MGGVIEATVAEVAVVDDAACEREEEEPVEEFMVLGKAPERGPWLPLAPFASSKVALGPPPRPDQLVDDESEVAGLNFPPEDVDPTLEGRKGSCCGVGGGAEDTTAPPSR